MQAHIQELKRQLDDMLDDLDHVGEPDVTSLLSDVRQIMQAASQAQRRIRQALAQRPTVGGDPRQQIQVLLQGVQTQFRELDVKIVGLEDQQGEPTFGDSISEVRADMGEILGDVVQMARRMQQALAQRQAERDGQPPAETEGQQSADPGQQVRRLLDEVEQARTEVQRLQRQLPEQQAGRVHEYINGIMNQLDGVRGELAGLTEGDPAPSNVRSLHNRVRGLLQQVNQAKQRIARLLSQTAAGNQEESLPQVGQPNGEGEQHQQREEPEQPAQRGPPPPCTQRGSRWSCQGDRVCVQSPHGKHCLPRCNRGSNCGNGDSCLPSNAANGGGRVHVCRPPQPPQPLQGGSRFRP